MFEVHDDDGQVLAAAATLEGAERALDDVCRRVTEQAATNAEGSRGMRLQFEIIDTDNGQAIEWLTFAPDPDRPYLPLTDTAHVHDRLRKRP